MTDLRLKRLLDAGNKTKGQKLDSASENTDSLANYTIFDLKLKVASAVHSWAEDEIMGENETQVERLNALLFSIADANGDGDITEEEQDIFDIVINFAADYLISCGVNAEDALAILENDDNDAAERVQTFLKQSLSDGDDADNELNEFASGNEDDEGNESIFAAYDSAYKKEVSFRGGKRGFIKKRISGRAHLSIKQKAHIRKMTLKSHSPRAMMKRLKSMKKRRKAGF